MSSELITPTTSDVTAAGAAPVQEKVRYGTAMRPAGPVAITVEGLSKEYRVRSDAPPTSAAEAMARRLKNPFKRNEFTKFEALNDINFEIRAGEAVGIIGHNGAGKSTLLKILTRITAPTTGSAVLFGRIGSLLEVGTGFHPELTGRENIFLNGSILGMRTREIQAAFDDIVEFAGVAKFLETPVKRYSSGMYVRLAFAVAAHLRSDILLVDEVLAVGDAAFQKKSRDRMNALTDDGRTILLVSHSMEYVNSLCSRVIMLEAGRVKFDGDAVEGSRTYLESLRNKSASSPDKLARRTGSGELRIVSMTPTKDSFTCAEPKGFDFEIERFAELGGDYTVSIHVMDSMGNMIAHCDSMVLDRMFSGTRSMKGRFELRAPWLRPGSYTIDAFLVSARVAGVFDAATRICEMHVDPIIPYPVSHEPGAYSGGPVLADFSFEELSS